MLSEGGVLPTLEQLPQGMPLVSARWGHPQGQFFSKV